MSAWWIVLLKEVRENLRDRRAVASSLVYGPLVGPVLFAILLSVMISQRQIANEGIIELPVIGAENAPALVNYLASQGVVILPPPEDPAAAVRERRHHVVLSIPAEFGDAWRNNEPARVDLIHDQSQQIPLTTVQRVEMLLQRYAFTIGQLRLKVRGISPETSIPMVVSRSDISTLQGRSALLLAMLPYFLILAAFVGGMYLAIDSTAGERERQSLEPLLLTAAPRGQLFWGKWLATSLFSAASLTVCVLAFAVSIRFIPTAGLGIDLRLSPSAVLLILFTVLPVALLASGAQLLVASFAKTFREAQSYLQLLILIPAIPSVFMAINPVNMSLLLASVPLMSQSMLIGVIARGDALSVTAMALAALTTGCTGAIFASIAIRLFRRESFALGGL